MSKSPETTEVEPTPEALQALQRAHIEFLESYFSEIKVAGVEILTCLTYKTIQVVNNLGLKEHLEKLKEEANA